MTRQHINATNITVCLMLLFVTGLVLADAPEGYPFMPFDKALQMSANDNRPVFIYFGRYGCGYCDKTNKEAFSNDKVKKLYVENYILAYVDAESGKRLRLPSGERVTEREVGTRYNAFVTPVFTFLLPNGEVILRLVGVQRIDDFLEAHAQVQKRLAQENGS